MITLTITKANGDHYWTEYFNTQPACDQWLATERTRPYWDNTYICNSVDDTPVLTSDQILAQKMVVVRMQRDSLLTKCDWTQLPDSPLASDKKTAWATYRQQLRDLPDQEGFNPDSVTWPTQPAQMSQKYLDLLGPAIDSNGLITQTVKGYWDGGDSLNREGMFAIAIQCLYDQKKISLEDYTLLRKRYLDNLNRLEVNWGNYRRHIDSTMWYFYPNRMSRDQWTPNAIAVGLLDIEDHRKRMFWGHGKRLWFFTTNTRNNGVYPPGNPKYDAATQDYSWKLPDLTVLSAWGYYIRAYKAYPLYPLLLVFDVEMFANSLIWLYDFRTNPTNTDILNHTSSLIQARKSMPTPFSWLARKILSVDTVLSKLTAYFSVSGPRIDLVFADFLKEIW